MTSKAFRSTLGLTSPEGTAKAEAQFVAKNEKTLQSQISGILRIRGILFLNPAMCKKSPLPIGWPDFTIFYTPSRIIFIECKVHGNKLTEEQKDFATKMSSGGFEHHVVMSLDEAIKILDKNL